MNKSVYFVCSSLKILLNEDLSLPQKLHNAPVVDPLIFCDITAFFPHFEQRQ